MQALEALEPAPVMRHGRRRQRGGAGSGTSIFADGQDVFTSYRFPCSIAAIF